MRVYVAALILGLAAVLVGTVLGGAQAVLDAVVSPPVLVRAALVGVSAVIAFVLLGRSLAALGGGGSPDRDMATMIRGVRLAFLAVAAITAAAGWFVGHPLLLIVALVIAGIDVVETTFLLIVARKRQLDDPPSEPPSRTA